MAKVITQNDLNEIIESLTAVHDFENKIVEHIQVVLKSITDRQIKRYNRVIKDLLDGELDILKQIHEVSQLIPDTRIVENLIKFNKECIGPLVHSFAEGAQMLSGFGFMLRWRYKWGLRNLTKIVDLVVSELSNFKVPKARLMNALVKIGTIKLVISQIDDILTVLDKQIGVGLIRRIKFYFKIRRMFKTIQMIAEKLALLPYNLWVRLMNPARVLKVVVTMKKILGAITSIFDEMEKVSILKLMLFRHKVFWMRRAIISLRKLMITLGRMSLPKFSLRKITALQLFKLYIFAILGVMTTLTLVSALMIPFIIVAPVILIAFWVVSKVIMLIGKIMFSIGTDAKLMLGIALTAVLIGSFILIAIMMVILIEKTKAICEGAGYLFGFFGILLGVAVVMLLFGIGMAAIASIAGVAIAGIGIMFVMVGLIFLLGLMLAKLQSLQLDKEAVKAGVQTVMDTAFYVIRTVFESVYEIGGGEEGQPWYKQVFSFIGGTVMTLISAILSVQILAISLVAIGLVLLLATQLRILQELDLNPDKITTNVGIVINTALNVVEAVFNSVTKQKDSKESKSWFRSILEFAGGALMHVISAILSVAILAVSLVSIQLILLLSIQLRILQSLDLKPDKIKENVGIVIDTALMVVSAIFDTQANDEGSSTDKGFIRNVLEVLGAGPILKILDAILSIAFLATSIFSMMLVMSLASQLKHLQSIDLDAEKIRENIRSVIDACHTVIIAIMQPDTTEQQEAKGFFRKLLEMALPSNLLTMIDALMSIGFLAVSMVAIGMVGTLAEKLTTISKLPSMANITEKAREVIDASKRVINTVFSGINKDEMQAISENASVAEEYLKIVQGTINSLNQMTISLTTVGNVDASKWANLGVVSGEIINVINDLTDKIHAKAGDIDVRLNQISKLQDMIKFFMNTKDADVIRTQKIADKYIEMLDKVNSIDLAKLQTTTNLFEQMAKFSESISGDFEGLADTLNDKIAPLMEELKELLDGVQKKVEKSGSDISASVFASKSGQLNSSEMANQTAREMPNSSDAEREQETRRRMEAQARQQNSEIVSKLAELIDLFEDGRARVKPVM